MHRVVVHHSEKDQVGKECAEEEEVVGAHKKYESDMMHENEDDCREWTHFASKSVLEP